MPRPRPALTHETATAQLARLTTLNAALMKQAGTRGLAEAPEALVRMVRGPVAETRALLGASPAEGDNRPAGPRGARTTQPRRPRSHGRASGAALDVIPGPNGICVWRTGGRDSRAKPQTDQTGRHGIRRSFYPEPVKGQRRKSCAFSKLSP